MASQVRPQASSSNNALSAPGGARSTKALQNPGYKRRVPLFWKNSLQENDITGQIVELHPILIQPGEDSIANFRPIVLLSLSPLPVIPDFVPAPEVQGISLLPCPSFRASHMLISALHRMTYYLWTKISARAPQSPGQLRLTRYFIAPLVYGVRLTNERDLQNLSRKISWTEMRLVKDNGAASDVIRASKLVPHVLNQIDHVLILREAALNLVSQPVTKSGNVVYE
ncbi:hypothetical protein BOTBODRAFT_218096 [Botryobasidium botryosum FD-172 SS1]|uniref:Uncharacterized protein n=1 Tax=Botryobasidium botryosum (strain FD-172 SS1) TaxID=930990 RepID=A0A067MQA3_BOTB1|nr:hypothetical protein BOTBODRAFT_218096 [Botryobasidium botryosum FD-172 SS1]